MAEINYYKEELKYLWPNATDEDLEDMIKRWPENQDMGDEHGLTD